MGIYEKTPYTNFHNLNLNWIVKNIKTLITDNTFFHKFFKTVEDENLLGVVTDVDASGNTYNIEYYDQDAEDFDTFSVYNTAEVDDLASDVSTNIAANQVRYYYQQTVAAVTSGTLLTISDSAITADSVVLECTFASPSYITSDVTWTSSAGSIVFTGTCTTATTANIAITLANVN